MLKAAGIILFIGLIILFGITLFGAIEFFAQEDLIGEDEVLGLLLIIYLFVSTSSGIYYIIKTKFGSKNSALDDLKRENEIIQIKIENKRLTDELDKM